MVFAPNTIVRLSQITHRTIARTIGKERPREAILLAGLETFTLDRGDHVALSDHVKNMNIVVDLHSGLAQEPFALQRCVASHVLLGFQILFLTVD